MNKTEAAYAAQLKLQMMAGEIQWYMFEGLKFRLADNTFYTPDFNVLCKDGQLENREVKGFWQDDARVKIKVAASMYTMRFVALKKTKSGWAAEEF